MKRILAVSLAVLITVACGLKTQDIIKIIAEPTPTTPTNTSPDRATLAVAVTDTSGAVPNHAVTIKGDKGQHYEGVTNASGYLPFDAEQDNYTVTAGGGKYEPFSVRVALTHNTQVPVALQLVPVVSTPIEQPFQNLNVRVFDAKSRAPIAGALVVRTGLARGFTVDGMTGQPSAPENRTTDGGGFANYGVRGASNLRVSAVDYAPEVRDNVQPGDVEFLLVSTKPVPTGPLACGHQLNTGFVSFECLDAVARVSEEWPRCEKGDADSCSLYVWEVVRALNDAQKDNRWGLITKPAGSNFRGYGEDVVAYLPMRFSIDEKTWQWNGVDIIGGLGGPRPTRNPGKLHGAIVCGTPEADAEHWCNRSDNLWSPVPVK